MTDQTKVAQGSWKPSGTIRADVDKRTMGGTFRIQRGVKGSQGGVIRAEIEIEDMTPLDMASIYDDIGSLAREVIFYLCHTVIDLMASTPSQPSSKSEHEEA